MSISAGGRVSKSRTSPLRKKFMIQLSPECQNAYLVGKPLRVALEMRTKDWPEAAKAHARTVVDDRYVREVEKAVFINSMPSD